MFDFDVITGTPEQPRRKPSEAQRAPAPTAGAPLREPLRESAGARIEEPQPTPR